jgi:hypothetical protein
MNLTPLSPSLRRSIGKRRAISGSVSLSVACRGAVERHGHRKAVLLIDATVWRDRVIDDVRGEGRAVARAYEVSIDLVIAAAEIIAAYMAAGESEISRTDLKLSGRSMSLSAFRLVIIM